MRRWRRHPSHLPGVPIVGLFPTASIRGFGNQIVRESLCSVRFALELEAIAAAVGQCA
jgi:hypothetical protein